MPQTQHDHARVRRRILDAARNRFTRYGFGKTTMAEIAEDCGMSAANLYRYFDSKQHIGAAMARRCLGEKATALKRIVDDPRQPAPVKIRQFVLASLRYAHDQRTSQPHLSELVGAVFRARRDIVSRHMTRTRGLLERIIDEGVRRGEFDVEDSRGSAEAAMAAFFLFDHPNTMGLYPREVFEQKATMVADLIVHGLEGGRPPRNRARPHTGN